MTIRNKLTPEFMDKLITGEFQGKSPVSKSGEGYIVKYDSVRITRNNDDHLTVAYCVGDDAVCEISSGVAIEKGCALTVQQMQGEHYFSVME